METLCIILRRAPYGTVDASEAIRHALGGAVEELSVRLVLLGSGANAARKLQDTEGTEYESIASSIEDCIDLDIEVYTDRASIDGEGMDEDALLSGIRVVETDVLAGLIRDSDQTMVF